MMPIIMGSSGNEYEIRRIGGNDKIKKHLANLGFVPGEKVTLVSVNAGSVIVNVASVSANRQNGVSEGGAKDRRRKCE